MTDARWVINAVMALAISRFAVVAAGAATGPLTVSGTVLDSAAAALAGARVEVVALESHYQSGLRRLAGGADSEPVTVTKSDAKGRFGARVPAPGVFRVVVRAPGRLPMQYLPLVAVENTELPPVAVPPASSTEVRVTAGGRPLPGAWVFAESASGGPPAALGWRPDFRRGRTDDRGKVVLSRRQGERIAVTALPPAAPPVAHPGFAGDSLQLRTTAGEAWKVRVVGEDGAAQAGVLVRAGRLAWPVGLTSSDGRLEVFAESGESVALRLYTADGRRQLERLPVAASAGAGSREATVVLRAAAALAGRVIAAENRRPLPGALVWSDVDPGAWARTDFAGRYQLTGSSQAGLWLQAEAAGRVPRRGRLEKLAVGSQRAPTLALEPSLEVVGTVLDPADLGLTDVRLAAVRLGPGGRRPFVRPDPADSRAITGAGGRFMLGALEPGQRYELRAGRPGFTPGRLTFVAPTASDRPGPLEIVLRPSRAAIGRLTDLEGDPIAGARVVLGAHGGHRRPNAPASAEEAERFRSRTDADGRFRIAESPATRVDLAARASGYAPMIVRGIELPPGAGPANLGTLALTPGAGMVGRIVDPEGEGIEGAAVHVLEHRLRPDPTVESRLEKRRPEATTGPEGRFRLEDLPAGRQHDLLVRASGYVPGRLRAVQTPPSAPVVIGLERSPGIHGWVLDTAGEPIERAEVHLELQPMLAGVEQEIAVGPSISRSAGTDAAGFFEISEIAGGRAQLWASADGFVELDYGQLQLPAAGESAELTLVLERGAVVEGSVADTAGKPVAGVRVALGSASAFADADGVYRVTGVAPGPVTAEAFHPYYEKVSRELEVEPGVQTVDWTLAEGREVGGRVVDSVGEPVAGARVRLSLAEPRGWREYRRRTSADGSFRLAPVADGRYKLQAEHEGYAPAESDSPITVAGAPVTGLELVLERGAEISGRILGLGFDQLAEVEVTARRSENERGWRARVDYQGRYRIVDLPPGDWLVRATLAAGRRQTEARVSLPPGLAHISRDLEFGDRLTLSGRVVFNGEPLPEALVSIRGFEVAARRSVSTDYLGAFRFEDLEAGNYWIGLSHQREWLVYNDALELLFDRDFEIRLESATVRGRVSEASTSQPIAQATVDLFKISTGEHQVGGVISGSTDAAGLFAHPRVTGGSYLLQVRKDGYAPFEQQLEVAGTGDMSDLEVRLTATRGLELDVRLASGQTPPWVDVRVSDGGGRTVVVESRPVDPAGRVRLPTVPAGVWELALSAPGGALTRVTAIVPGEPVPVLLPAAGQLQVRVSPLVTSSQIATLSLVDSAGGAFRALDVAGAIQDRWPLVGGRATVERVPAGVFTLYVEAPDGRRWSTTVATPGAAVTEAVLH